MEKYISARTLSGKVTVGDLPPVMVKLKAIAGVFSEDEIKAIFSESSPDLGQEVDFENFLRVSAYVFWKFSLVWLVCFWVFYQPHACLHDQTNHLYAYLCMCVYYAGIFKSAS